MKRGKDKVSTFSPLHEKFKEIGLLTDLNLSSRDISVDYVRLCLARAELYREEYNISNDTSHRKQSIRIEQLPLGPLSHIVYKNDYALERLILGVEKNIPQCMVCLSEITRGQTTLLSCACRDFICRTCAQHSIGGQPGTYHDALPGLTCPFCRQVSYCTVQNAKIAIKAESRLVKSAFSRFTIDKGPNQNKTLCVVLMLEAKKLNLHYHPDFEVPFDARRVSLEIARLQVLIRI